MYNQRTLIVFFHSTCSACVQRAMFERATLHNKSARDSSKMTVVRTPKNFTLNFLKTFEFSSIQVKLVIRNFPFSIDYQSCSTFVVIIQPSALFAGFLFCLRDSHRLLTFSSTHFDLALIPRTAKVEIGRKIVFDRRKKIYVIALSN